MTTSRLPIVVDFRIDLTNFFLNVHFCTSSQATALVGHSRAGKSTTLKVIAGLKMPDSGVISIGDRVLFDSSDRINTPTHLRRVGYIPQINLALFPHMNVLQNITYGFWRYRHNSVEKRVYFDQIVEMTGISSVLSYRISRLAANERQRVALARALLSDPDLLVFDEPLIGLDKWRKTIIPYLQRVRDDTTIPLLYVTHNIDEVKALAQSVVVLNRSGVTQCGPVDSFNNLADLMKTPWWRSAPAQEGNVGLIRD